jgi:hypothetical protein
MGAETRVARARSVQDAGTLGSSGRFVLLGLLAHHAGELDAPV